MGDEIVVDASVAAKAYFHEEGSETARALLTSGVALCAPELIALEIANVAVKRVRLGLTSRDRATAAVEDVTQLIHVLAPLEGLRMRALSLACEHGFSAYDAAYLALAEERGAPVVTADIKLLRRAREAGFGHLVHPLIA